MKHLVELFNETRYPTTEQKIRLARAIGLTDHQVNIWFKNKRKQVN